MFYPPGLPRGTARAGGPKCDRSVWHPGHLPYAYTVFGPFCLGRPSVGCGVWGPKCDGGVWHPDLWHPGGGRTDLVDMEIFRGTGLANLGGQAPRAQSLGDYCPKGHRVRFVSQRFSKSQIPNTRMFKRELSLRMIWSFAFPWEWRRKGRRWAPGGCLPSGWRHSATAVEDRRTCPGHGRSPCALGARSLSVWKSQAVSSSLYSQTSCYCGTEIRKDVLRCAGQKLFSQKWKRLARVMMSKTPDISSDKSGIWTDMT